MFPARAFVPLYLLSLFLIGVGYIAIMPPFEGFDETAHYASLRQIADTGTIPLFGESYLPRDVADYGGPLPYSTPDPPFDLGLTYAKFFADPALVARFVQEYRQPQAKPPFVPSDQLNWESQHPPLYYLILAPVLHLVETTPFVSQMLILRLVSYLLALGGVYLGLKAIPGAGTVVKPTAAAIGFLVYPIMLPMFFPEFARIGNDSLCLLLTGLAALCLTKEFASERSILWPLALGISLGLGLLTKAFFIPVTFAIGVFLLVRFWRIRDGDARLRLRNGLVTAAVAVLIGGGWYLRDYLIYGDFSGSADAIRIVAAGGIWANLKQHHSVYVFARSIGVMTVTWIWAGTWSFVRMSALLYAPLFVLVVITICGLATRLEKTPLASPEWLPVLLFVCLFGGLLVHVLDMVELGWGGTGGWYLHLLMPWVAPALGLGIEVLVQRAWSRAVFVVFLCYAALFQMVALWAQIALFTGCAVKGDDKYYSFPGSAFCLDQAITIYDRMAIIGWPVLAIVGFGGGLFCAGCLVLRLERKAVFG